MSRTALVIAAALAFAATLSSVPAQAQRDRVFVASYGTDTGNTLCSFTQPCRTFQNAVNNVAVNGEVTAIDSAGFQPVSITQSVTITSPNGVEAGIQAAAGGNAITINTTTAADITLRGLTLEGAGVGNIGINVISTVPPVRAGGGTLNIVACVVKDFTGSGILPQPAVGTGMIVTTPYMNVVITDSLFTGNATGIEIGGPTSGVLMIGSIYRTVVSNNGIGIDIVGGNAGALALLVDSHVDSNSNTAILVNESAVIMKNTTATNTNYGTSSNADISVSAAGVIEMYDRNIIGNLNNGGTADTDGTNIIEVLSGNALKKTSTQ